MYHTRSRLTVFVLGVMLLGIAGGSVLADATALTQRSDIDDKYKWRTEDIYATIDAWEKDYNWVESRLGDFEQYQGNLGQSAEMLYNCLMLSDSVDIVIGNLYVFAFLKLDEDNRASTYQELGGRVSALNALLGQRQAFIRPEILSIGIEQVETFLSEHDGLAMYRFYLEDIFRQNEHVLSPDQEELLAMASPLARLPMQIFNMIDNADHKMGQIEDTTGQIVELNQSRYTRILKGTNRDLRQAANDTVQNSWKAYLNTLSVNLGGTVERDWFFARARKYPTCLDMALNSDNIPTSVFYNLIEAVNANLEPLHKWVNIRKRVLGYDTMYTYDLSVSVVPELEQLYSYEETKDMLLKGLKPLGKEYVADLKDGFEGGWIDVFESEGKGSGAYSWGTYTSHPFVLLNYDSTLSSVFTLAHEMGHALNRYYTNQSEPYVYSGHALFTAEVASTINEAILMKHMLSKAKTRDEKLVLLDYYIRQIEGTFFTQVMFSEFELTIHNHLESGGAFSADFFRQTYRAIFQKYYGPDLVIGPENDMGCFKIYHFYRQYYVYQYATCYAAAQSLSQQILENQAGALDRYHHFLKSGSSQYPVDILKDAGIDMTTPEPIQRTISLFGELVDEMERLLFEEG